jgi:hypothetical protein
MPSTNLWTESVSRVEIDQRSREARLQFEQIDRLFILSDTVTHSHLKRLLYFFTVDRYGRLRQEYRTVPSAAVPSVFMVSSVVRIAQALARLSAIPSCSGLQRR